MNPYQRVLDARMRVCEALAYDGPEAALGAVVESSITLAPLAGPVLLHHVIWDALQEVCENTGLVAIFGQDAVQAALAFGPRILSGPSPLIERAA